MLSLDNHDGENPKRVEYYAPERLPNSESEIFDTVTERGENFVRYQHSKVSCTPEGKLYMFDWSRRMKGTSTHITLFHYST